MPGKLKTKKEEKSLKKRGRPRKTQKANKKIIPEKKIESKKEVKQKIIEEKKEEIKRRDYVYAVGKRKSAIARVRYYKTRNQEIIINNKDFKEYFPYFEFQKIVLSPLELINFNNYGGFSIKVQGGGKRGQAEGIKLGISRILLNLDKNYCLILKKNKFLTRDSRVKERKKYGLRGARRTPQWQKR